MVLCNKCKPIVIRELNALGDQVKIMIETMEKTTGFVSEFTEGRIKGCIDAMKDFQDNLSRFSQQLGL